MSRLYLVEVMCPHCGGEPGEYISDVFTVKRDALKYKREVEKAGNHAQVDVFVDEEFVETLEE